MKDDIDRLLSRKPFLKAREIAKELGVKRKDVNSLLYSHPDDYRQDDQFRWCRITGGTLTLTLPGGWVTGDAFESILTNAGRVLTAAEGEIKIVFSPGSKTMIDCTARILAISNQLVMKGKGVTMDFTSDEQTRTYLDRAGFFDYLDPSIPVLPLRPEESAARRHQGKSDTLVEFGDVDPAASNDELIEQLTTKFVQQATDKYHVAAYTVFSELIGNVREHSQTPLRGFAGLQKYSGIRDHIQTVVSDSGVGIAKTLRPALKQHYPQLHRKFGQRSGESDLGLVEAAMSQGGISRFGGAHGLGFKSSRAQAMKFNARFSVRQERFCLKFEYRNGELVGVYPQRALANLLGTHICFDFYLD